MYSRQRRRDFLIILSFVLIVYIIARIYIYIRLSNFFKVCSVHPFILKLAVLAIVPGVKSPELDHSSCPIKQLLILDLYLSWKDWISIKILLVVSSHVSIKHLLFFISSIHGQNLCASICKHAIMHYQISAFTYQIPVYRFYLQ